jgi:hypothetical protein
MKNLAAALLVFGFAMSAFAVQAVVQNGETVNVSVSNCKAGYYADASVASVSDDQVKMEVSCKPYICAFRKAGKYPLNYWSDSWIIYQAKADQITDGYYQFQKVHFFSGHTVLVDQVESSRRRNELLSKLTTQGKCATFMRVDDSEVEL